MDGWTEGWASLEGAAVLPGVPHALLPEVPQQLLVFGTERVQRVCGHDGGELLLQVVGHLPLASLGALRLVAGGPGRLAALGQHHRVAVLVQQDGHGHGGGLGRVGGRGELVGVDAAAALLVLLGHPPHVQHKLALAQQRAVVHQQQVDVVQGAALALAWRRTGREEG